VTQSSSIDANWVHAILERVQVVGAAFPRTAASLKVLVPRFHEVEDLSQRVWTDRWKTDIVIDGPVEDQLAVRSFLFYLRSAIGPNKGMAVSPFGLSSDTYSGHVFWDADIWVFPALAFIAPQEAAEIPRYRLAKMDQARSNYREWVAAKKPTAMGTMKTASSSDGIMFPWESSVTGSETMPGPSRYEHHITGSVAFSVNQAAALGLVPGADARNLIREAATFYKARSIEGPKGREIKGVVSPDETHVGDNDLYTNLLAEWLTNGGSWKSSGRTTYKLPQDSIGLLTYDDDALRSYKQAAAVLSIYPLQFPPAEVQAQAMMNRFGSKVIKNGPAMSDSVHAIIWARAGATEQAYQAWRASWQPFTTGPLELFSEKRSRHAGYFVTGAAGSLQSVLYGFLGIGLDSRNRSNNAWSTKLLGDHILSATPHLPKEWKSVKLKNFTLLGRRLTLTATQAPNGGTSQITQGE
jgi:trehalose/maltose hydrolase-like predicted phosphorylase